MPEFRSGNYLAAVNHWLRSKDYMGSFFGHLPLQDDLNNDQRIDDVTAYLEGQVTNFFSNLKLSFLNLKIFYDVNGQVSEKPMIYAEYIKGPYKTKVSNLPLRLHFLNGTGTIAGEVTSGNYGESSIPIAWVDPTNATITIILEIDREKLNGLEQFALPPLPSASLTLSKKKTIVLSVFFNDGVNTVEPEQLKNQINSTILGKGFSCVIISLPAADIDDGNLERARRTNADYLLTIAVTTTSSGTAGGFSNMYVANCSGKVALYKLLQSSIEQTENIASIQGFGVSASGAAWDAFGKLMKTIDQRTSEILEKIQ